VPAFEIRPFRRPDRDQLAALVNAHVAAVVPGVQVSVNTLLAQMEREPDEAIVDPWVVERRTLVALERDAVVAGAHLHRYGDDNRVGESYRGAAEIRWIVARPEAPDGADALVAACLQIFAGWKAERRYADCSLPVPFCYGITENWPHLRELLVRSGFRHEGRVELILQADVAALAGPGELPLKGLELRRKVGAVGTRLAAFLDGDELGMIEVEQRTAGGRNPESVVWADVGNLRVSEEHRRRGIATWLLGHAADWLRLGGVERLADYAWPEQEDLLAFLHVSGFRELTRTNRGWVHR
jgi:GNAT superfamily N-acetyltransferase